MTESLAFGLINRLLAPTRGSVADHVADYVRRLRPVERAALREHLRGRVIKIELTPILLRELERDGGA